VWILPSLIGWFWYRHRSPLRRLGPALGALGAIHLFLALFPFETGSSTRVLAMIHIPFLSWLLLLPIALDRSWRSIAGRVHYLRLSAEAFIYSVLVGAGAATLAVVSIAIFASVGIELESIIVSHGSIATMFGIPVLAVALADRKRQVIENFAPILARIFAPLFAVAVGAFLATVAATGAEPAGDRQLLLVINALLLMVGAILFYDVSARGPSETRVISDWANVVLTAAALALNLVAVSGIWGRLVAGGVTPNRVAVLGLNAILLVHLLLLFAVYLRYMVNTVGFRSIERTVVRMVPIYGAWLALVVVGFPIVFGGA
jgi:hypothetical protein